MNEINVTAFDCDPDACGAITGHTGGQSSLLLICNRPLPCPVHDDRDIIGRIVDNEWVEERDEL
jgi:hypothetical protein